MILVISDYLFAQIRDISFYIHQAEQNNTTLKQNERLRKINLLQNDLIIAQNLKPQVYFTSDYLFAPYFNNNGRIISVTPNPEPDAFGYDPGITNGGLYSALLNVEVPLLNSGVSKSLVSQNNIQNQILLLSTKQLIHDIENQVLEKYLNAYSIQLQMNYLENIIKLIEDRKKILDALLQKGIMQQSDYLILDIELNSRIIEQHQQMQLLTDAFIQLNNISGIADTIQYELAAPDITQLLPVKSFNFLERYRIDSINIAAQQSVLETNFNPQLNLLGNLGLQSTDLNNIQHHFGTGIGLQLNIPIFNGNQKSIQIQQNKISFDTLTLSRASQIVNVNNSLMGLSKQISMTRETIALNQSQISRQELLLNILQEKLFNGQVSTLEYVRSIEDYALTNQNVLNAKITLMQLINQYNYLNW